MSSITNQIIERLKELRDQLRVYGLVMGGTLIGIELMFYYVTSHFTIGNIMLFFLIKIGLLFYVSYYIVKKLKPVFFKKGMNYSQSFSLIFRLFLYGALFAGLYTFVLNQWVNPEHQAELIQNTSSYVENIIADAGLSDTQMDMFEDRLEDLDEITLPTAQQAMWNRIWHYIVWGAFVGLILSAFTRDKDINPFSDDESTTEIQ